VSLTLKIRWQSASVSVWVYVIFLLIFAFFPLAFLCGAENAPHNHANFQSNFLQKHRKWIKYVNIEKDTHLPLNPSGTRSNWSQDLLRIGGVLMKARADSPLSFTKDFDTTRNSLIKRNQRYTAVRMHLHVPVNTHVNPAYSTVLSVSHNVYRDFHTEILYVNSSHFFSLFDIIFFNMTFISHNISVTYI